MSDDPEIAKMFTDYANTIAESPATIDMTSKVDLGMKLNAKD